MSSDRQIGNVIESRRRVLSEGAVALQYELQPELTAKYPPGGREKCVQDTEYHLSFLAAAVTYGSPTLFANYMRWVQEVLNVYDVSSAEILSNLTCLEEVLGQDLASAAGTLTTYFGAARQALAESPSSAASFLEGDDALTGLASSYLGALLRFERHHAGHLLKEALEAGATIQDIYLQIFQRCQREVGRLWQVGAITVAQEHYCTAAVQLSMSQLYPQLLSKPKQGRRLIATSVPGELHEVGLRIVTDLFEEAGWDTIYLGSNLPAKGVIQAIEQHRPQLLLVSATMAYHLGAVEQLISEVRSSKAGEHVKVLVGGYPCNIEPELWQRLGADGCACDATEALAIADKLVSRFSSKTSSTVINTPDAQDGSRSTLEALGDKAVYQELTRLNNELLTAHRELARKQVELESVNRRLVEVDRRKDEFLATLAHELRNPLAPIRSGLEVMRMAGDDRPDIQEIHRIMEGQTKNLIRLVEDLLDTARINSGKINLQLNQVELASVMQSAVDASRGAIEALGHELSVVLPPQPVLLTADATRLAQVFSNLLNNAARYTPAKGHIWFNAERQGSDVVVSVRDTGIGIPSSKLESIFDMFMQVERPLGQLEGGLGIGLSLVKKLVQMHNGSVEAHSEGPGQGSEFQVRLPMLIDAVRIRPASDDLLNETDLRVLIVDDSRDAALSLAMLVKKLGNEVYLAHDGLEGVDLALKVQPDVVLMDIGMPQLNGYEAARRMREQPWANYLVLVALTGWGQEEDKQRAQDAGFDHHLIKPLDVSDLKTLLAGISGKKEAAKTN